MLFLTLSNINIWLAKKELEQKGYSTTEALSTTQRVELINKKEFAIAALDENVETFIVYVAALLAPMILVHFFCQAQIELLLADKAFIEVLPKYLNYTDVFSFDLAIELLKNTDMNKYAIELVEDKQLPYRLIYSLALVKQETLKTYIETYLKTGFI